MEGRGGGRTWLIVQWKTTVSLSASVRTRAEMSSSDVCCPKGGGSEGG